MIRFGSRLAAAAAALLFPLATISAPPTPPCPEGLTEDWRTDFCALRGGNDAAVIAQCLNVEKQRRFEGSCEAKLEYKQALCTKAAAIGGGSAQRCLRDPAYLGDTVRRRLASP